MFAAAGPGSFAARVSKSIPHSRTRVLSLYRRFVRAAPSFLSIYQLPVTARLLNERVAKEFRKHNDVSDPLMIDLLIHKGGLEFQEAILIWKQRPHLAALFDQEENVELDPLTEFLKTEIDPAKRVSGYAIPRLNRNL
eukprot:TRINITY_DN809_c0_g1_i2.p1 TRINITY_DN809_c0_g1~~TRINITY_DN809_c0_g1_i2.p1  ORF type:complete len:138 (-),score=24.79 TRINITY_DN809_c0_g1_i2:81-494(-)